MTVPNNLAAALIVDATSMLFEEGFHFVLQSRLKHLPRSFADQLIQWTLAVIRAGETQHSALGR
ncbi:MAG: hypothetical protein Q8K78_01560 [Planctomycetaceae bacterium]|nr:hypothetical protein [Planctomycetaceae bacterium]